MAAKLFAVLIFVAALTRAPASAQLGPKDGGDPRPTELERVKVGQAAPDFTLEDVDGKNIKTIGSDKTGLFLADDATKSVWDGLSGRGAQGPLKSKKLEPLPMTPSFWFGWVDHYPHTELFALSK
jgi:hypothetical protein